MVISHTAGVARCRGPGGPAVVREKLDFMNHEAGPPPRRKTCSLGASWRLKETTGPSGGARRLYESLVTVLRRGD